MELGEGIAQRLHCLQTVSRKHPTLCIAVISPDLGLQFLFTFEKVMCSSKSHTVAFGMAGHSDYQSHQTLNTCPSCT